MHTSFVECPSDKHSRILIHSTVSNTAHSTEGKGAISVPSAWGQQMPQRRATCTRWHAHMPIARLTVEKVVTADGVVATKPNADSK